jgi:thiamine-phosphate pyrophosphorylase
MSDSAALRIIDANANRAREALRVLEDYARFALNSAALQAELKAVRHELTDALAVVLPEAILHRDTGGDVGTAAKTQAELSREDMAHVVTAAGKRLGEALRCLEEFAKVDSPATATRLEKLRYRFYVIEQTLALTLRPTGRFGRVRLYVLITEEFCAGRPWQEVAEAAIAGGAECLQIREKSLDAGELLRRAREMVSICRRHDVLVMVNDRVDVALAADADGVHLGQTDLPAREARRILGPGKLIGVSTQQIEHARAAVLDGADYIGVGPMFRSSTKTRDILPGLDYAREVVREITIPAVAIAGITFENAPQVVVTGIKAIAVTQAVTMAKDVAGAARAMRSAFDRV